VRKSRISRDRWKACHGDGWGRSSFAISLMPPPPADNQRGSGATPWLSDDTDRLTGSPLQPFIAQGGLAAAGWRRAGTWRLWRQWRSLRCRIRQRQWAGAGARRYTRCHQQLADLPNQQDNPKQALSLWLGGAVDFGQQDVKGNQAGNRFRTNGIGFGGDYRINAYATFGLGAGFSRDRSDIGDNGTRNTAEAWSARCMPACGRPRTCSLTVCSATAP